MAELKEMLLRAEIPTSCSIVVHSRGPLNAQIFADDYSSEVAEEYQKYWIESSRELAYKSSDGKFILAEGCTHRVHGEALDIIIANIVEIMER